MSFSFSATAKGIMSKDAVQAAVVVDHRRCWTHLTADVSAPDTVGVRLSVVRSPHS
jgi:hypothetical protein